MYEQPLTLRSEMQKHSWLIYVSKIDSALHILKQFTCSLSSNGIKAQIVLEGWYHHSRYTCKLAFIPSCSCSCNVGYALAADGKSCQDINECKLSIDDCDTQATCTNTVGSYTCTCLTGKLISASELLCF